MVAYLSSLSPSKRSVRPLPVVCKFISGFVYLIYNASIISNRLKSFSCLIMLVLLTIYSLFNVLQRTNILYKYECNVGDCEPQAYIGYTRTTLSRRITMHLQSGAPLKHSQDFHSSTLNREQMVSNTSIIRQENDFNRLEIMEALYIKYTKPEINLQTTGRGRTLRLLGDNELSYATNSYIRHQTFAMPTSSSPALSHVPDTSH